MSRVETAVPPIESIRMIIGGIVATGPVKS
jgi:hypothetical protein